MLTIPVIAVLLLILPLSHLASPKILLLSFLLKSHPKSYVTSHLRRRSAFSALQDVKLPLKHSSEHFLYLAPRDISKCDLRFAYMKILNSIWAADTPTVSTAIRWSRLAISFIRRAPLTQSGWVLLVEEGFYAGRVAILCRTAIRSSADAVVRNLSDDAYLMLYSGWSRQ